MAEKQNKEEMVYCPIGRCLREFNSIVGKRSKFRDHLIQYRVEILKGIRSLVDARIEHLNTKISGKGKKRRGKTRN